MPDQLAEQPDRPLPGPALVGTYSPPFRPLTPDEDVEIVDARSTTAAPDIVCVGLSTPKQERWMAAHIGLLHAPALLGVGAAFDIHAGTLRQAPRWMQRSGLEWLFRLAVGNRVGCGGATSSTTRASARDHPAPTANQHCGGGTREGHSPLGTCG